MTTFVNIRFEAILGPTAKFALDRLRTVAPTAYRQIVGCISELETDPYPPASRRAPLVIPGRAVYPEAHTCEGWRIAYHVVDDVFIFVDDIAHWPPGPF
jgi:hypothetical protein